VYSRYVFLPHFRVVSSSPKRCGGFICNGVCPLPIDASPSRFASPVDGSEGKEEVVVDSVSIELNFIERGRQELWLWWSWWSWWRFWNIAILHLRGAPQNPIISHPLIS